MLTVLAYILTLVLSQFAFTIGSFIIVGVLSFVFIFLPSKIRTPFVSFIAHTTTVVITIEFGHLIFWLLHSRFGLLPGLVAIASSLIPMYGDYKEYKQMQEDQKERMRSGAVDLVIKEAAVINSGYGGMVLGNIVGIIVGVAWLLFR